MFSLVRQLPRPRQAAWGVFSSDFLYLPSLTRLVEREGNDPTSSGFSDQRSDLISYLSICMGGNFIERHVAATPRSTTKGKRRFRAYYLSRISIRLPLKHRRVSNHFDTVLTFKLGNFCIPLPWVCFLLFKDGWRKRLRHKRAFRLVLQIGFEPISISYRFLRNSNFTIKLLKYIK